MRKYIEDACEEIDAAIFSGDAFFDPEHRAELRKYITRWINEMQSHENSELEELKRIKEELITLKEKFPVVSKDIDTILNPEE